MDKLRVEGGRPLRGEVEISGAKNAALPLMAASLLAPGVNRLGRVPALMDVRTTGALLRKLGARVEQRGAEMLLDTGSVSAFEAPYDLVKTMRASVLVLGPLLARYGRARVSLPGGCAIGARPINLHIMGLRMMGARVALEAGYVVASAKRLRGARIYLDVPTVTGTENLLMAAALAKGTTIIENAAREPEVANLGRTLAAMGARVKGAGESVIEVEGVDEVRPFDDEVIADRIECGTFMTAAAITGGDVLLKGVEPSHLDAVVLKLRETGVEIAEVDGGLRVSCPSRLRSRDLRTMPYPGFPTDMQAQFMALMAVAQGTSVIHERIFENRFMHVAELRRLGADIIEEAGAATVRGVRALRGADVMATDLRASASLVVAALAAEGATTIHRIYHLDRGYERIEEKLRRLGASVERLKE
ncbi:MAG: UDP-N-acetylglucosamine 1-carboxyvinyltransferase [Nitrospirota bacterium]|jgi:UDP-N-acetylglucosamine 1-carboxyvinyltransferase